MKRFSLIQLVGLIVIITIAVSFLLFSDFGKSHSRIIDEIMNLGHIPLFGVISLFILWILHHGKGPYIKKKYYVAAGIVTLILGFLTEYIQLFIPNRDFQWGDILADTVGVAIFLVFAYPFPQHTKVRKVFRAAALILALVMLYPLARASVDTWNRVHAFPTLGSFETSLEIDRWNNIESEISRAKAHATKGTYSLKVLLLPGVYPGISLNDPTRDWRGYQSLAFEAYLEGSAPLALVLRVNDREHNNEYSDRFNRSIQLDPGQNRISVNLEDIMQAPRGRIMDMSDIVNVCLFSYRLRKTCTVYFDNFRLE